MRIALFVVAASLALTSAALAQVTPYGSNAPGAHPGGNGGSGGGGGGGHGAERPAPPPLRRCPDLAIANYAFVTAIPGQDALGADEIAVQWNVQNGGNAPYTADGSAQSLALEYSSPSGVHQIAALALPPTPTGAVSNAPASLGQGQNWRGYLRATLSPEARRRTLRLRIAYAADGFHTTASDCDFDNNVVQLAR